MSAIDTVCRSCEISNEANLKTLPTTSGLKARAAGSIRCASYGAAKRCDTIAA
jgi:hypothetical protein